MSALVIAAMALVTYLPRLFPFYVVYASKLPATMRRALRFVPYAALGALIVPDAFTSVADSLAPSAVAIGVAAVSALVLRNVGLTLLAAVGAAVAVLAL